MRTPPSGAEPRIEIWPAGQEIVRVHPATRGSRDFNRPPDDARFRPVRHGGRVVGTLYGTQDLWSAAPETALSRCAGDGPAPRRVLPLTSGAHLVIARLCPRRDLRLVELHGSELHGSGLRRLGMRGADAVDTSAAPRPQHGRPGQRLFERVPNADGLVWMSRQFDPPARADALVGPGRRPPPGAGGIPLGFGNGLVALATAAEAADITLLLG